MTFRFHAVAFFAGGATMGRDQKIEGGSLNERVREGEGKGTPKCCTSSHLALCSKLLFHCPKRVAKGPKVSPLKKITMVFQLE